MSIQHERQKAIALKDPRKGLAQNRASADSTGPSRASWRVDGLRSSNAGGEGSTTPNQGACSVMRQSGWSMVQVSRRFPHVETCNAKPLVARFAGFAGLFCTAGAQKCRQPKGGEQ